MKDVFQSNGTKIDQTLLRLLQYQTEKKFDPDGILMALCLFNLAEMMQMLHCSRAESGPLAEGSGGGAAPTVPGDLQSLLAPLMSLISAGMGQGNPANLLSLLGTLSGGQGKGGSLDLTSLLGLLSPLLGLGVQGGMTGPPQGAGGAVNKNAGTSDKIRPVHKEINLDHKTQVTKSENEPKAREEPLPKPGEILEWKFGT